MTFRARRLGAAIEECRCEERREGASTMGIVIVLEALNVVVALRWAAPRDLVSDGRRIRAA